MMMMMMMETGFNHLRFPATVLFLLLFLHPHLLLALPLNSMVAHDLNHEKQNSKDAMEVKQFSIPDEAIAVVKKRGGGAVAAAHGGGEHGNAGNGGGDNGRGSGGQIPVYAAGAGNHNRDHLHHGSTSGTVNYIGTSCLPLIPFMFFFICLLYVTCI
ncbi:hypothetical protein V6Z11_D05G084400 [Gossypium hirsutum]